MEYIYIQLFTHTVTLPVNWLVVGSFGYMHDTPRAGLLPTSPQS